MSQSNWTAPTWSAPPQLDRIRGASLGAAVVGIGVCVAGAVLSPRMFFSSYLGAFMFWLGLSLGSTAFLCLYHLVGGDWGRSIRRALEAASLNLLLMFFLFIPIFFGVSKLYDWSHWPAEMQKIAPHKFAYFKVDFFYLRAVIYFVIWIAISFTLNAISAKEDQSPQPLRLIRMVSGPSIAIYGITITAAAFDWVMSLQPHWYSSMFGLIYVAGQGLTCISFMVLMMSILKDTPPLSRVLKPGVFNDMGNLMLAFTMLYAYTSFSQYLIIWSGNIKDEVSFFMNRTAGFWGFVITLCFLLHFALPFLLLLSRDVKRNPNLLWKLAVLILVMRVLELYWQIEPAVPTDPAHASMDRIWRIVLNIAAPLAIGGVWMFFFIGRFKSRSLLARHPVDAETSSSALFPPGGISDRGVSFGGQHA